VSVTDWDSAKRIGKRLVEAGSKSEGHGRKNDFFGQAAQSVISPSLLAGKLAGKDYQTALTWSSNWSDKELLDPDDILSAHGEEDALHSWQRIRRLLLPVVVGGGKRALPDVVRSDLELLRQRCCLPQVLPSVSLSDGADLGDPGLEHPARAGRRDVPTGLARGSGLGNSHRSSAGVRAAGPARHEADPGPRKGPGSA